ncbi:MAG: glycoside hydrolase family 3 C-terminal domain-containing protein [Myxococcota bacterium]|nr:glycoside hydrolase family 3 C-terminal domain-containing protein [Myxococcota bacterium]
MSGGPGSGAAASSGSTPVGGGMYDATVVVGSPDADIVVTAEAGIDAAKLACGDVNYTDAWSAPYTDAAHATFSAQAASITAGMSVMELAQQMRGTDPGSGTLNWGDTFRTLDTPRGGNGFHFRDGPRGVNLAAELPTGKLGYSTAFPVPIARGAAFDMDLEKQIGAAIADETVAAAKTMLLAPVVNILRHPAWGRAQETYGEDSYMLGRLGTAFTVGAQQYIPACVKHYAANNIENGRASQNAQMDDQTLHEIYGRQFEMVVQDGGVACVMAAYNLVNGKKATLNPVLLTDMLRTTFGFKGFVLSDWWAMPPGSAAPGSPGATTAILKSNAQAGVSAGLDMELPWALNYGQLEAIAGSTIMTSQLSTDATRVIEQKVRFKVSTGNGLKPASTSVNAGTGSIQNNAANIQLAYKAALESMVLLKNDKNTLPINKATVHTIAVIGSSVPYTVNTQTGPQTVNFATDVRTGDMGSSRVFPDPALSTGPAAGIGKAAGSGIKVVSGTDPALADTADFVVVVAGLTPKDEGEEYTGAGDRTNFGLDGKAGGNAQNNLIAAVAAKNKPMAVVLEGGSVIDMPWLAQVPAVVMAWYPGMDGGHALGDLLLGNASFSGKLPLTWPKSWNDEPTFNDPSGTTTMSYYLGYRYFENKGIAPLYAFGHGLSYTTFSYSNLFVPCSTVTKNGVVQVQVDVTNTGTVAGDEVAFLFASFPSSGVMTRTSPNYKELKGFRRVSLMPKETKRITFAVRVADLKYWDSSSKGWKVESGPVQIQVGSSYDNLLLKDTMTVQ